MAARLCGLYNNAKGRTTSVTRTARAGNRERAPLVSLEVAAICAVLDGKAAVPEVLTPWRADEGSATAPVGVVAAPSLVAPAEVSVASPASAATPVMVASPDAPG